MLAPAVPAALAEPNKLDQAFGPDELPQADVVVVVVAVFVLFVVVFVGTGSEVVDADVVVVAFVVVVVIVVFVVERFEVTDEDDSMLVLADCLDDVDSLLFVSSFILSLSSCVSITGIANDSVNVDGLPTDGSTECTVVGLALSVLSEV